MRIQASLHSQSSDRSCRKEGLRLWFTLRFRVRRAAFCCISLCLVCSTALWAQAFTNLNFEAARLVPIPKDDYSRVYFSLALPGWVGYSGTNQLGGALYDMPFLDSSGIAVFDSGYPLAGGPLQGNYDVFLEAGYDIIGPSPPGTRVNASLSQIGLIPAGTKSIVFLGTALYQFSASVDGANLSLLSVPVPDHSYNEYKADVSMFAGQTNTLTFTALVGDIHEHDGWLLLDAISFSTQPIPEPRSWSLLAIGFVGLAVCALRIGRPTSR